MNYYCPKHKSLLLYDMDPILRLEKKLNIWTELLEVKEATKHIMKKYLSSF